MAESDVIRKIRALLELAGNNPNENERNAAQAKAEALQAQYNIDQAQLLTGSEEVNQEIAGVLIEVPWKGFVLQAVTTLYYTQAYKQRQNGNGKWEAVFIGTPTNRTLSIDMLKWLIKSIEKEAGDTFCLREDKLDFCNGAALKILDRARDIILFEQAEAKQEHTLANPIDCKRANQLVLVRTQITKINKDWMRDNVKGLTTGRTARPQMNDGFRAGSAYGSSVSLNKSTGGHKRIGMGQ